MAREYRRAPSVPPPAARDHGRVKPVRLLVALGAALAMADGSIVVLALPDLAASLRTTVAGAAAVIGVYTGVLAAALPLAAHARRRVHPGFLGAGGLALFAAGWLGWRWPDRSR